MANVQYADNLKNHIVKKNFLKYSDDNHQLSGFFNFQCLDIFFSLYSKFPLNAIILYYFFQSMKNHTFYTFDFLNIFLKFFQKIQHKILIKMVMQKNEKQNGVVILVIDMHDQVHE